MKVYVVYTKEKHNPCCGCIVNSIDRVFSDEAMAQGYVAGANDNLKYDYHTTVIGYKYKEMEVKEVSSYNMPSDELTPIMINAVPLVNTLMKLDFIKGMINKQIDSIREALKKANI